MAEPNTYCVVLARRDDITREDFLRIWLGEHRRLIGDLPGLQSAQLLPVAEPADGGPDGVGLLYFGTGTRMSTALASPAAVILREHTVTFAKSAEATRLLLIAGR
jgi:hypothetical protein